MKWLLRKLFRCWDPRRRQLVQIDDSWPVLSELGRWNQSDLVRFISECNAVQVNGQAAVRKSRKAESRELPGLRGTQVQNRKVQDMKVARKQALVKGAEEGRDDGS